MKPSQRLAELNISLPPVNPPVGSYIPGIRTGNKVMVSGQLPMANGKLLATGKVGSVVYV